MKLTELSRKTASAAAGWLRRFVGLLVVGVGMMLAMKVSDCIPHSHELSGAWTIVKQAGHDNYGYVTELGWGFVNAGFKDKESAIAAMKEARYWVRHPPKQEPPKPMWEPQ